MIPIKTIKDYSETHGKTVKLMASAGFGGIAIYFTDNTCLILDANHDEYDCTNFVGRGEWEGLSDNDKVKHGVMTQEEADERRAQAIKDDAEKRERIRFAEYTHLHRHFKGVEPPPPGPCPCGFCQSHGPGACRAVTH